MEKTLKVVVAISVAVIALNLTYSNFSNFAKTSQQPVAVAEEKVVEVVGKFSIPFDGIGASTGFIVKDGDKLGLVHYDEGSMFGKMPTPKYLTSTKFPNGHVYIQPALLHQ